jgi:hypothetical protein
MIQAAPVVAAAKSGGGGKWASRYGWRGFKKKNREASEQNPNRGINQQEDKNKNSDAPAMQDDPAQAGFFFR